MRGLLAELPDLIRRGKEVATVFPEVIRRLDLKLLVKHALHAPAVTLGDCRTNGDERAA